MIEDLPTNAANVQGRIEAVSVGLENPEANFMLAARRGRRIARFLKAHGMTGKYTITVRMLDANADSTPEPRGQGRDGSAYTRVSMSDAVPRNVPGH